MGDNSLMDIHKVRVTYEYCAKQWVADATSDTKIFGVIGYQESDLSKCQEEMRAGIALYFENEPYELIETVLPKSEGTSKTNIR